MSFFKVKHVSLLFMGFQTRFQTFIGEFDCDVIKLILLIIFLDKILSESYLYSLFVLLDFWILAICVCLIFCYFQIFPDNFARREISMLTVHCRNQKEYGCTWLGPLKELPVSNQLFCNIYIRVNEFYLNFQRNQIISNVYCLLLALKRVPLLTLFWMGFLMYVKGMGRGKITPPPV